MIWIRRRENSTLHTNQVSLALKSYRPTTTVNDSAFQPAAQPMRLRHTPHAMDVHDCERIQTLQHLDEMTIVPMKGFITVRLYILNHDMLTFICIFW